MDCRLVLLSILASFLLTRFGNAMPARNGNTISTMVRGLEHTNEVLPHIESKSLNGMFFITHFADILHIKDFVSGLKGKVSSFGQCVTCKLAVAFLQHYVNNGASEDDIGDLAYKICTYFSIETPRVCSGVTKLFKRELAQVLLKVFLNPEEMCGFFLPGCGDVVNPLHDWNIPLTPFPKPPVKPPKPPKPGSPVLHALHISDVHIDPYYVEGSNAMCGEPLCCRNASGMPYYPEDGAGYWGDYRNCDIPLRLLENMLSHINQSHQIDYVIWTGDIPPHDIWNNSRGEAVDLLHIATDVIHKHLGNVPIYPALGNHESSPVNSFPIPLIKGNESISWLYTEVYKAWSPWLPNSEETLKAGAYYTAEVSPGFRIISLNMNYCNSLNWWLLMNSTDPTGQLSWLVEQLQMAENKGEKVHIIGHIPPGQPDCLGVWSKNYYKIINRYESTVTAQFFGHTHMDEFEIFYESDGRPTSIAYIGPSVTTYDSVNPGYRIYTVDGNYDGSSRVVLDHETYITNLTEANTSKIPKWQLEYSAKKAYNMESLLPKDWDLLTRRFVKDENLFQLFYKYFYKMSDYEYPECDDVCKKEKICKLRRGQSNNPLVC